MVYIKTAQAVKIMAENGRLLAQTLALCAQNIRPGVTTRHLDKLAYDFITKNGAHPSFLGYDGFPASLCISVNEEVIHGIPSERKLQEGDIVSIDGGVYRSGYHADAARTFSVGAVSPENAQLIEVCRQAFYQGFAAVREGARVGDIGAAIEGYVAPYGYGIVRDYTGHGVGEQLHEDPPIPNYQGFRGVRLAKGMTLAIEPMLNGGTERIRRLKDGWTVVTQDGKPSAHYENTVALLDEPVILTDEHVCV